MYHNTGLFFTSPTQMFTGFTYKLGLSNTAIPAPPFTRIYRNQETRADVDACRNPSHPHHHCARLLCVFPAGFWAVTLSFGRHCHPASASQLRSVLVWQWGQGYTGGKREEVTSQRGSWKRCPEIQQRTAEETQGGRTRRGVIWCPRPF